MKIEYPQYRKYGNGLVYFKILSPTVFEEARKTSRGWEFELHPAKVHPDRVLISDMVDMRDGYWLPATEDEYPVKEER